MSKNMLAELQAVALKEMRTSRVGLPPNMKKSEKFKWIEEAYGRATVVEDFRKWCRENKEKRPRYPITEYVKVADDRLSESGVEPELNLNDERIKPFSADIYDLSGFTPTRKSVAVLLFEYTVEELLDAAKEYVDTLDEKEYKAGMKRFFNDGAAAVVIYARRNRK